MAAGITAVALSPITTSFSQKSDRRASHGAGRRRAGGEVASTAPLHSEPAGEMASEAAGVAGGGRAGSSLDAAQIDILFGGAMPKAEIQADQFISEHPTYDGRGVVVAILDTGVDPGAAGLQTTTDGKPKARPSTLGCLGWAGAAGALGGAGRSRRAAGRSARLGRARARGGCWGMARAGGGARCTALCAVLDGWQCGDVDTSTVVKADADGWLAGPHGRRLRVNPAWRNPSGEWRVGCKAAYELFPAKERRRKWGEAQRAAVADAVGALAAFDADATGMGGGDAGWDEDRKAKARAELEARVKLLGELEEKAGDLGPLVDCVVWHDGAEWLAALGTTDLHPPGSGRGELAAFEPMASFRARRQWGTFSAEDACSYALNIYDEGATLSIVVDAGSHGTHVAGIVAAHHPEDPSLNGVAPGAQIVSCKIGDSRLGSMETGVGLARALVAVLQNGCHLINMSYGEATATPNAGGFVRLAEELVHKHGVTFVASAGNAGPALSTVGAPGGTASAILGIGAYLSPHLACAGHSLRAVENSCLPVGGSPDATLTYGRGLLQARNPWRRRRCVLPPASRPGNGTGMCAGAAPPAHPPLTLPLGHLLPSPPLAGHLSPSLLPSTPPHPRAQVCAAWEYLQRSAGADAPPGLRYETSVRRSDSAAAGRGIHLREPRETGAPLTFHVDVAPKLHEEADTMTERLSVEAKLLLRSTAPGWLAAPAALLLHHNGRGFEVEVDPTKLPEGLHYAEVQAFDATAEWRGPLFRVPAIVTKPLLLPPPAPPSGGDGGAPRNGSAVVLGPMSFIPGQEVRRFVAVPEGAGWAQLRLRAHSLTTPKSYMVRATQLLPHTRYTDSEYRTFLQLEHVSAFAVRAGGTLEVTLAQFWSRRVFPGNGTAAAGGGVLVDGSAGSAKLVARAPLRRERVKPSAKLDVLCIPLRPTASELAPLPGPRDALPGGRTPHRLVLTYSLKLEEAGKVTPRLQQLNRRARRAGRPAARAAACVGEGDRYIYDAELQGGPMVMVFDANKQRLGVGDVYPEAVQLAKGEYSLRVMLRHEDAALLDRLRQLPLVAERKLDPAVAVPVYESSSDSLKGSNAVGKERWLCAGERCALFVGPVPEDKLPKDATPGRMLGGTLSLGLLTHSGKEAPGATPLTYVVPPAKKAASTAGGGSNGNGEGGAAAAPAPATAEAAAGGANVPGGATGAGASAPPPSQQQAALDKALLEAQVKFVKDLKIEGDPAAASFYQRLSASLQAAHPTHLPLLLERLRRRVAATAKAAEAKGGVGAPAPGAAGAEAALAAVVEAAGEVEAAIDASELAIHLAQKCPDEGPGAAQRKKDMEERKAALAEALAAKCTALLDLRDQAGARTMAQDAAPQRRLAASAFDYAAAAAAGGADGSADSVAAAAFSGGANAAGEGAAAPATGADSDAAAGVAAAVGTGDSSSAGDDGLDAAWAQLRRWADPAADHPLLFARREAAAGRLAGAYKALAKLATPADGVPSRPALELRASLLARLGWQHWEVAARRHLVAAFPPAFPPF
eukprot:scaffold10.g2396.t1